MTGWEEDTVHKTARAAAAAATVKITQSLRPFRSFFLKNVAPRRK